MWIVEIELVFWEYCMKKISLPQNAPFICPKFLVSYWKLFILLHFLLFLRKKKMDLGKILRALVLLEGKDVIGRSSSITVVSTPKYQSLSLSSDQLQDTQPIQTQKANHNYAWIELKSVHLLYETKMSVQV